MISAAASLPEVDDRTITFELCDALIDALPDRIIGVRLLEDVGVPAGRRSFTRLADRWELVLDRPPVGRLEYLLEIGYADGRTESICDPANPHRVPSPFGDKSVIELPGYLRPDWLGLDPPRGRTRWLELPSRGLPVPVRCLLWTSAGALDDGVRLPLLVAHDGPEYARLASLVGFLDAMVAAGRLPQMRAALLAPIERNENYSASPAYARALALGLLPALQSEAPHPDGGRGRIGMGASLGALAMLHAQRRYPETFGGLFLQSGSFFQLRLDDMESAFARFGRVTAFVRAVLRAGPDWRHAVPAVLSCGSVEENLANNAHMARALSAQGYGARLHVHPDSHNWVSWRDVFDPCLPELAASVWG